MSQIALFEIKKKKAIPLECCYIIKPLNAVIDKYGEEEAGSLFAYMYYVYSLSPDNPFRDLHEDFKEDEVQTYLEVDVDESCPVIEDAKRCVERLFDTTYTRSFRAQKAIMDRISDKFLSTLEIQLEKEGNSTNITNLMKNMPAFYKSLEEARMNYEKELGSGRAKGGKKLGIDEEYDDGDDDDDGTGSVQFGKEDDD